MQHSERISALLDNAGDEGDLAALREIAQDPTARHTWARYHLISDLRHERDAPAGARLDLTGRVAAAIASYPPPRSDNVVELPRARTSGWTTRTAFGLAAAASLAAIALFSTQSPVVEPPAIPLSATSATALTPPRIASVAAPAFQSAPTPVPTATAGTPEQVSVLSEEEYQRRINSYLVNFNEQRAQMGVPGVHPYVRVVGFESAREP